RSVNSTMRSSSTSNCISRIGRIHPRADVVIDLQFEVELDLIVEFTLLALAAEESSDAGGDDAGPTHFRNEYTRVPVAGQQESGLSLLENANIVEIAVLFRIIEPVANNELIRNRKADVAHVHRTQTPLGFI